MTIEILQSAMIEAMKNKDKARKDAISSIIGAIKKSAIDKKCKDNITEELVNEIIIKERKVVQEMVSTCPEDRADLRESYLTRLSIVEEFAPKMLTKREEIEEFIDSLNIPITKENRANIMKQIKSKVENMKVANQIITERLR